ncbi:MAG: hypothetical protein JST68_21910 [Bacteroidetes bacterium]|nr:hypothetical protein [Bacteroidota bacterium]
MEVKTQRQKAPAVVVSYRLARPYYRVPSRYLGMFLPADRQFKLKVDLVLKDAGFGIYFISDIRPGFRTSGSIFQFVLPSEGDKPIHDVEIFLDKPGQIVALIIEAKQAPTKRAQHEDLSVWLEDWDSLNAFHDFPIEENEKLEESNSGLRLYEYTETAHTLLNDVIAGYTRLAFRERKKEIPNTDFLAELDANKMLALDLLRQPETFSSIERLLEVIEDYTPIARTLFDSSSSSSLAAS